MGKKATARVTKEKPARVTKEKPARVTKEKPAPVEKDTPAPVRKKSAMKNLQDIIDGLIVTNDNLNQLHTESTDPHDQEIYLRAVTITKQALNSLISTKDLMSK